jgi:kynurenine formamidase
MQLIDLSQSLGPDTPRFSSAWPPPTITPYLSHAQSAFSGRYVGTTVEISFAQFITSLGTYLDSPFHFNPDGAAIDRLDLSQLVLPGLVVDARAATERQALGPELLAGHDIAGKAVLLNTGWSAYWGQAQYVQHPFVSAELAAALRDGGARLLGCDTLLADDPENPQRPAHVTLLNANVLIVENLTQLAQIPPGPFTFHAAPAKVVGAAAFPVRAYAVVE